MLSLYNGEGSFECFTKKLCIILQKNEKAVFRLSTDAFILTKLQTHRTNESHIVQIVVFS